MTLSLQHIEDVGPGLIFQVCFSPTAICGRLPLRTREGYPPGGGLSAASSISTSRSRWVKVVGSSFAQLFDQLAHLDPTTFTQRLREVDIELAALRPPPGG